jgi:predicted nucleotidyltransferase
MPQVKPAIRLPEDAIRDLCRRHGVEKLAVFGSVLRQDFREDSDLDFLVQFHPEAEKPWMGHFAELEEALEKLLGRSVDLVDWKGVEQSQNWIRRQEIFNSAQLLYAA